MHVFILKVGEKLHFIDRILPTLVLNNLPLIHRNGSQAKCG